MSNISHQNYDFLREMKEDETILDKLEKNFNDNVVAVKAILK